MSTLETLGIVAGLLGVSLAITGFGLLMNGWRGAAAVWIVMLGVLAGLAMTFIVLLKTGLFYSLAPK